MNVETETTASEDMPLLALVGPTGTGKTALSIALAQRLGGEIVNADSMQFYRGMDIGTAKVTQAEREMVPHHLLDILELRQEASVAAFQTQARECFQRIRERGHIPILVGGSGLYVRAALDHIDFPGTDPEVRARLEAELAQQGIGTLRARLQEVDPESAAKVQDARRVVRALEVYEVTGRSFTAFMPQRSYMQPTVQIALKVEREKLYERLAHRVKLMVDAGLEQEVRSLIPEGLREGKTASKALGYSQFLDVIDGQITTQQAIDSTITATCQFAKRQLTWFRADPRVHWVSPVKSSVLNEALDIVQRAAHAR